MRGVNKFIEKKNNDRIIMYENDNNKVFFFNREDSSAFSIDKKNLINRIQDKVILKEEQSINQISKEDKNIITKEIYRFFQNDNLNKVDTLKLSINLNNLIHRLPHYRTFVKLWKNIILYLSFPLLLFGIANYIKYPISISINYFYITEIIYLIIVLLASILLHEISHALMAIHYGAFVPEIGFKVKAFTTKISFPIFYTSIIGKKNLEKNKKIQILLAGPCRVFL